MPPAARTPARPASQRLGADDWVQAALNLIGEEGLAAVKIDRLATRLKATKGSFYWHFEDLGAFMDAVAAAWCSDREQLRSMLDSLEALEPRERLLRLLDLVQDTRYWRLERASREWARTNERVSSTLERSDRWLLDAQQRALAELGFSRPEARLRANTLFYAALGFLLAGPASGRLDRRQADGLIDLLTSR